MAAGSPADSPAIDWIPQEKIGDFRSIPVIEQRGKARLRCYGCSAVTPATCAGRILCIRISEAEPPLTCGCFATACHSAIWRLSSRSSHERASRKSRSTR
jgi:hypothetical protein